MMSMMQVQRTLAVEDDFDKSKPSRRWPATMRLTEGESGEWTMKRVYGPRKESADHDKGLMTMLRVHRTIKVKSLRTIKEKSPRTVKK